MARHEVGDRLVVTAAVTAVLTERSFVLADVDLPDRGLLVLGAIPESAGLRSLVTVDGTVDRFEFDRFVKPFLLDRRNRYAEFDGRKIVVADSVSSWS
jgi:hypothetical protein